jgi:hypothetical protein
MFIYFLFTTEFVFMTTLTYLQIAKCATVKPPRKFDDTVAVNERYGKMSEHFGKKNLSEFITLALRDNTNTVLNLFYDQSTPKSQDTISKYIIFLYDNNSIMYNMMNNTALLSVLRCCIDGKKYDIFNIVCVKITSGYYDVMHDIINYGDDNFMNIFKKYCAKSFYYTMINNANTSGKRPFDNMLITCKNRSRIRYYDYNPCVINYIPNRRNEALELLTYMYNNGAYGSGRNRDILLNHNAHLLLNLLSKYTTSYKKEDCWMSMRHSDLIFTKILSYL